MVWSKNTTQKQASIHRRRSGQAMVEFALIFPIIVLVSYGLIELGRFMFVYASVSAAAREAARYGSAVGVNPDNDKRYFEDCDGIRATVYRVGQFAHITEVEIKYDYGHPSPSNDFTCPPPNNEISTDKGARIHVTVTAEYRPFFLFSTPTVEIKADSAHTIVRRVSVVP